MQMTIYLAARFLHVVGALIVFSAVGLEIAILRGLTLAPSSTAAHAALAGLRIHKRVGIAAMLLILVPGVYMAIAAWGMPAWLIAAIVSMVSIIVLDATATRRSLAALGPALQEGSNGKRVEQLLLRLCRPCGAIAGNSCTHVDEAQLARRGVDARSCGKCRGTCGSLRSARDAARK
jgi:hypothetical protein